MDIKYNKDEIWEIIGYVKVSPNRYKIIKALNTNFMMPSEIARKTDLTPSQVTSVLYNLKKAGLVECMNEKSKKGRIYQNTELGLKILNILEENRKSENGQFSQ